jgi:hypothetical protein
MVGQLKEGSQRIGPMVTADRQLMGHYSRPGGPFYGGGGATGCEQPLGRDDSSPSAAMQQSRLFSSGDQNDHDDGNDHRHKQETTNQASDDQFPLANAEYSQHGRSLLC